MRIAIIDDENTLHEELIKKIEEFFIDNKLLEPRIDTFISAEDYIKYYMINISENNKDELAKEPE